MLYNKYQNRHKDRLKGNFQNMSDGITAKKIMRTGVLLVLTLAFTAWPLFANDIKARMKERLPVIFELKSHGIIGETNRGYLEYVTAQKPKQNIVDGENKDRHAVYKAIAAQQGVPLGKVETLRALQIVKKAKPGEFLQAGNGAWYKK